MAVVDASDEGAIVMHINFPLMIAVRDIVSIADLSIDLIKRDVFDGISNDLPAMRRWSFIVAVFDIDDDDATDEDDGNVVADDDEGCAMRWPPARGIDTLVTPA